MNAAESYWRLYRHPGDAQPIPVELMPLEEQHGYVESNFIDEIEYESFNDASEALKTYLTVAARLYLPDPRPEHTVIDATILRSGLRLEKVILVRIGDYWLAPGDDEWCIPHAELHENVDSYKVIARPV